MGRAVACRDLQTQISVEDQVKGGIRSGSETGPTPEMQKKGQGRAMHLPEGINPKPVVAGNNWQVRLAEMSSANRSQGTVCCQTTLPQSF